MNRLKGRSPGLRALWKGYVKGLDISQDETGKLSVSERKRDPSLSEQLRKRQGLHPADLLESYLDACKKAPGASEATKRKWKKALGI